MYCEENFCNKIAVNFEIVFFYKIIRKILLHALSKIQKNR